MTTSTFIVHTLGWTLLHFVWEGAAIAALVWCCLRLTERASSRSRYAMACAGLALLVVLPLATFGYLAIAGREAIAKGAAVAVPGMTLDVTAHPGAWQERLVAELDQAMPVVLGMWIVGVVVFLLRLQVGLAVARRLRTMATSPVATEMAETLRVLRKRMGVARPVLLLHSALVHVPTVVGWMRPVLLVPVGCFTGLSSAQVEAILCHELAHVLRHDYLISVAQSVVEALLFYHPAVWWISKQVRRERECCCDELAVQIGGDVLAYARALEHLETRRSFYPEVALQANGGVLTMRIKRMLGKRDGAAGSQVLAMAVLTMVVALGAASLGSMAEAKAPAALVPLRVNPVTAGQEPKDPQRVPAGVMAGQLLTKVDPAYPVEAKKQHISGAVVLKAVIGKEGKIESLAVESGPSELTHSALDAVRQWVYKPYLLNGEPTEVQTTITVNYSIEGVRPAPPADTRGPIRVSAGTIAGNLSSKASPQYPEEAKRAGIEGPVVLKAVISKEGKVDNLSVLSGPLELRASAIDAVKQWTYRPYLLNGEPTEVDTTITVNYKLDHPSDAGEKIGNGVSAPVPLSMPDPVYTEAARKAKVSGEVLVSLVVDEKGDPSRIVVKRSLRPDLDQKAIEAVAKYKFKPAMKNGEPVRVELQIAVNFQIF